VRILDGRLQNLDFSRLKECWDAHQVSNNQHDSPAISHKPLRHRTKRTNMPIAAPHFPAINDSRQGGVSDSKLLPSFSTDPNMLEFNALRFECSRPERLCGLTGGCL